jgi:hypothetical protein
LPRRLFFSLIYGLLYPRGEKIFQPVRNFNVIPVARDEGASSYKALRNDAHNLLPPAIELRELSEWVKASTDIWGGLGT